MCNTKKLESFLIKIQKRIWIIWGFVTHIDSHNIISADDLYGDLLTTPGSTALKHHIKLQCPGSSPLISVKSTLHHKTSHINILQAPGAGLWLSPALVQDPALTPSSTPHKKRDT